MVPRTGKRFWVHGHRGSRGTHPENTLAAFDEALDAGADFIELDVHLSRDGIPIVVHDAEITSRHYVDSNGRRIDTPVSVHQLDARELCALEAGRVRQSEFPLQKLAHGLKIQTLEEVFEWRKTNGSRCEINIEIKREPNVSDADVGLMVSSVVQVAKRYQALQSSLFQSFDHLVLLELKRQVPKSKRAVLFEASTDYIRQAIEFGADFVSPDYSLVTEELVRQCHQAKIGLVPWTVNDEKQWERLISMGVDGIITDFPRRLIQFVKC